MRRLNRLLSIVRAGVRSGGGFHGAIVKAVRAYQRGGLSGLKRGIEMVDNDWKNKPGVVPLSLRRAAQRDAGAVAETTWNLAAGNLSRAALSSHREIPIPDDPGVLKDPSRLIAFYLPQFHRIAENSKWWGPGFTEWTNVAKGRPNFVGHYQPHIPRDLGFYDLGDVNVMREQADLARRYGVHGFCFYYYWFSGRRILERPLDNFLKSDIDLPFCLCWANENWTRTWDGDRKSVLLEQRYLDGDEERFIRSILPFFEDPRYIRVGGRPLLVVYRAKQIPNPGQAISKWRENAINLGLPGLHIVVVDFYDISDPREVGADAMVEFPPHKFNGASTQPTTRPIFSNPNFAGGVVDYSKIIEQAAVRNQPDYSLYRGVMPGWDNTARRQDTPTIVINNTPGLYGIWLRYLRRYNRWVYKDASQSFIFVNAWNEWGEGCHLEPDLQYGMRFLEETARSAWYDGTEGLLTLEEARDILAEELQSHTAPPASPQQAYSVTGIPAVAAFARRIDLALRKMPRLHAFASSTYRFLSPRRRSI